MGKIATTSQSATNKSIAISAVYRTMQKLKALAESDGDNQQQIKDMMRLRTHIYVRGVKF
jgi:hypothetical protein